MDATTMGIGFENILTYNEEFNVYLYKDFYNESGIGLGDLNNDGLLDVLLNGNQVGYRCYMNKSGFNFEDVIAITVLASPNVWMYSLIYFFQNVG